MSYFIYYNDGIFTTVNGELEQPTEYELKFEASDAYGELASAPGSNIELKDGVLTIIPATPVIETEQVSSNIISKMKFLKRLTPDEYSAIKQATLANPALDYFWQLFMLAEEIDLAYPDTIAGINMMEQIGLLGTGRAVEILS